MGRGSTSMARGLRKRSTDSERRLWKHLQARRMRGLKFRRQEPIGRYIVDFVCYEAHLVIELDGACHASKLDDDRLRDSWLEEQGFRVIRVLDNEVLINTQGVLEVIDKDCQDHQRPGER